jgi:uncharacterized protein (TIGR02145 family)
MSKILLFILCGIAFAQTAKPKFVVSVSGELDVNSSDALADIINHAVIKSKLYSVLPNDRQFRETLKSEWKKGNVSDDRIIALAKNAGADYLCFAKITSLLGSNQIAVQLVNLKSEPMEYSNMGIARGRLNDLDYFADKVQEAIDDMLGIESKTKREEPKTVREEPVQKSISNASDYGNTFTDSRDGKTYKIVKIGTQTWMAENLSYNAYGSKCYGNQESNCQKYGRHYDWNTAMKACPKGWHLPSDAEWTTLTDFVGGSNVAGTKLKAKSGWNKNNGTDAFGFSALPGGGGRAALPFGNPSGSFGSVGEYGIWWSATESSATIAWRWYMYPNDAGVGRDNDYAKTSLYSVRCVQD